MELIDIVSILSIIISVIHLFSAVYARRTRILIQPMVSFKYTNSNDEYLLYLNITNFSDSPIVIKSLSIVYDDFIYGIGLYTKEAYSTKDTKNDNTNLIWESVNIPIALNANSNIKGLFYSKIDPRLINKNLNHQLIIETNKFFRKRIKVSNFLWGIREKGVISCLSFYKHYDFTTTTTATYDSIFGL